jgi:hypothetical protein
MRGMGAWIWVVAAGAGLLLTGWTTVVIGALRVSPPGVGTSVSSTMGGATMALSMASTSAGAGQAVTSSSSATHTGGSGAAVAGRPVPISSAQATRARKNLLTHIQRIWQARYYGRQRSTRKKQLGELTTQ